jgi:hypothetical protein
VKGLLFFLLAGLIWGLLEYYFGFTLRQWLLPVMILVQQTIARRSWL